MTLDSILLDIIRHYAPTHSVAQKNGHQKLTAQLGAAAGR
jgi:hypothetical protein